MTPLGGNTTMAAMAGTLEIRDVNLLDPSLYRNGMPYDLYDALRAQGPVLWHPETHVPSFDADIGFWAVLGHREVQ